MPRSVFILFVFALVAPVIRAQDREFPIETDPLNGDVLQAAVWDFSQQWVRNDRGRSNVQLYGDSLLAETIDGRRFWYSCSGDSVSFCGEEDRLTEITLDSPAFSYPRPLTAGFSNNGVPFMANGAGGGKRFAITESGTIESTGSARKGTLILAPGDTVVNALAVRERHYVTATFPGDSTAVPTVLMTETCRWYDPDGGATLIPLVIQRATYYPYNPSDPSALTALACLPRRGDYEINNNDDAKADSGLPDIEAVNGALEKATVSCDGRTVSVSASLPQAGLVMTLDIVDATGHLYLHAGALSSGAADEITVDCSGLRSGEYIAVAGVEDLHVTPKKQLVLIR